MGPEIFKPKKYLVKKGIGSKKMLVPKNVRSKNWGKKINSNLGLSWAKLSLNWDLDLHEVKLNGFRYNHSIDQEPNAGGDS